MIVVTGATGHVGHKLVSRLLDDGQHVRAMTRRPEHADLPEEAEVVYGDCDDPASLTDVFRGAHGAFLMSAQPVGSAAHPTHDLRLVQAAVAAGVRQLVKLSVYSGGTGADALARWHGEAEWAVTESGLRWTLLRPGRFASNALAWAPMIRRGDTVHVPFLHRPAAPIDPDDVAAVAAAALTGRDYDGAALQLSGPQVLTPADELRILGAALGRQLNAVEAPVAAVAEGMRRAGLPPEVVDAIVARTVTGTDGATVLPTVEQILGRPATPYADWAAEHAAHFKIGCDVVHATRR